MKAWKSAALVAALVGRWPWRRPCARPVHGRRAGERPRARSARRAAAVRSACRSATSKRIEDREAVGTASSSRTWQATAPRKRRASGKGTSSSSSTASASAACGSSRGSCRRRPPAARSAATLTRDGQKVNVTVEPRESNSFSFYRDGEMSVLRDLAGDFDDFAAGPPVPPARPASPVPPVPPASPAFPDIQRLHLAIGQQPGHHGHGRPSSHSSRIISARRTGRS